jgi:Ca2+/H+ antiporter
MAHVSSNVSLSSVVVEVIEDVISVTSFNEAFLGQVILNLIALQSHHDIS